MDTQSANDFDVIIAGGGMVGASLALALSKVVGELRILVVERHPLDIAAQTYQPSFDGRSTALALGSVQIYQQMGVWQSMQEHAAAIAQVHVSNRGRFGSMMMNAEEEGLPALGYVIENAAMGAALLQAVAKQEQIEWRCPASIEGLVAQMGTSPQVVLDDGTRLSAELVIIADGARSKLAKDLGINTHSEPFNTHAVVANVAFRKDHQGIAYERFTERGPLALLPLVARDGQARAGLVMTVPDTELERVMGLDESAFLSMLQERFGYRVGRFTRLGQRFAYPLESTHVSEQGRAGVLVMGNAAHLLNPVAGQGFNLALRDVVALVNLIHDEKAAGRDLGQSRLVGAYTASRSSDQWLTTQASGVLPGLFALTNPLIAAPRDSGLIGMDLLPPLRSWFIRQAAGLGLQHPTTLRGGY